MEKEKILLFIESNTVVSSLSKLLFLLEELLLDYEVGWIYFSSVENLIKEVIENIRSRKEISIFALKESPIPTNIDLLIRVLESTEEALRNVTLDSISIMKLLGLDDWPGVRRNSKPVLPEEVESFSLFIVPSYHPHFVDGFSSSCSYEMEFLAKKKGIPVLMVETFPMFHEFYYPLFFADYYAVRYEETRTLLIEKLGIPEERVYLLKDRYNEIFSPVVSEVKMYIIFRNNMKNAFKSLFSRPTITVEHNLNERFRFREVLKALQKIDDKFNLLVKVHPERQSRHMKEKEIVETAYKFDFARLRNANISVVQTGLSVEFFSLISDVSFILEPTVAVSMPKFGMERYISFSPFFPLNANEMGKCRICRTVEELGKEIIKIFNRQKNRWFLKDVIKDILKKEKRN